MDKMTPICSRMSLALPMGKGFLLRSLLFPLIYHSSNGQVIGLGKALKLVVEVWSLITINAFFRRCLLCTLREINFENHGRVFMTLAKE